MPCKSSTCYSVSYHPNMDEFQETKALFKKQFAQHYSKDEYILVPEKGSNQYHNHYQGFIKFTNEKRADAVRKSFNTQVMKDIEVSDIKIALKITPITRDVKLCQGYCLKELKDGYLNDVISNFGENVLVEGQEYYKNIQKTKKTKIDKNRINKRNIHLIFKRFYEANEEKYGKKEILVELPITTIIKVLADMIEDGYWMGAIALSPDFHHTVDYLHSIINGKTYEYLLNRRSNQRDIYDRKLEKLMQMC